MKKYYAELMLINYKNGGVVEFTAANDADAIKHGSDIQTSTPNCIAYKVFKKNGKHKTYVTVD